MKTSKVELVELAPNIYAVEGVHQKYVATMFLRIQEHYESPRYRNKFFTMKEFKKWYASTKDHGRFSYFEDWSGFNVPGVIVKRLMAGKFPEKLNRLETWLKKELEEKGVEGKFYLLGYAKKDARVKKHEIAHGLFYTNPEYRKKVKKILSCYNMLTHPVSHVLRKQGYHQAVVLDEFHAWVLTDFSYLKAKGVWSNRLEKTRLRLEKVFREFHKGSV